MKRNHFMVCQILLEDNITQLKKEMFETDTHVSHLFSFTDHYTVKTLIIGKCCNLPRIYCKYPMLFMYMLSSVCIVYVLY